MSMCAGFVGLTAHLEYRENRKFLRVAAPFTEINQSVVNLNPARIKRSGRSRPYRFKRTMTDAPICGRALSYNTEQTRRVPTFSVAFYGLALPIFRQGMFRANRTTAKWNSTVIRTEHENLRNSFHFRYRSRTPLNFTRNRRHSESSCSLHFTLKLVL